ncbi:N-acetylglucosamine kinase [Actinocatenispora rupis]|uniref:N-acetylglucosamine kinase n=1 Tax=Actinocatenispora rupis TaxID=519421 RepID=A0A8J3JD27_9ACTN|nr:BadF/BadG/BcrA/BcrD ATPase family protein [Actinocatenispora rupis]GID13753.1 N-acetylglucosamine kinase [Actinocatenispora rupis]
MVGVSGPLVMGADVGGTSAKVVLADASGRVLGRGTGPGGNLRSSVGDPAGNIGGALRAALGDHDPAGVVAGVIGMAGSAAVPERAQEIADGAWRTAGLGGSPLVRTDLDIAYAAGATGPDGALLLAGTGAVAAAYQGFRMVERCDGLGWLLGDEGSAVWFGLAAVRAAAADLDGRGPGTELTGRVGELLRPESPTGDPRQDLVAVAYQWPPARFGELAPTVTAAAEDGDEVAGRILADGCAALVRTALVVAADAPCLVLAGSLLTSAGPIADRVRAALAPYVPVEPVAAPDPVAGAVLDALRAADLPVPDGLPARLRAELRP